MDSSKKMHENLQKKFLRGDEDGSVRDGMRALVFYIIFHIQHQLDSGAAQDNVSLQVFLNFIFLQHDDRRCTAFAM